MASATSVRVPENSPRTMGVRGGVCNTVLEIVVRIAGSAAVYRSGGGEEVNTCSVSQCCLHLREGESFHIRRHSYDFVYIWEGKRERAL